MKINKDYIELNQTKYINKLAERFKTNGKAYKTPIEPNYYFVPWHKDLGINPSQLNDRINFMR